MRKLPPVTQALLIANVALFLLQQALGDVLLIHFALWPLGEPQVLPVQGGLVSIGFEPWQLVTYAFLHGGFAHLAFNMLALYMFGGPLEELWGSRPFALYYFVAVIGAALLQLATVALAGDGFYPTLGASGGIFGLLLGYGMMYPHHRIMLLFPPIPMPAWLFVILYGAAELFMGVSGTGAGVAHFAHIGGMITGVVMIQYWRGRLPIKPRRRLMR